MYLIHYRFMCYVIIIQSFVMYVFISFVFMLFAVLFICILLFSLFVDSASLPFKLMTRLPGVCSGGEDTPPETLKCLTPNPYSWRRLELTPGPAHPSPTPNHCTIAALLIHLYVMFIYLHIYFSLFYFFLFFSSFRCEIHFLSTCVFLCWSPSRPTSRWRPGPWLRTNVLGATF